MTTENNQLSMDALLPPAMAEKAEEIGIKKANMDFPRMFLLAVLAGAFIAQGGILATIISTGNSQIPFGLNRLFMGLVFSLGLILVIVAGAELFTGNILIVMAYASKKVTLKKLLRNWLIVYLGNFVGSVLTALVVFFSKQYSFAGGMVGLNALNIANAKTGLDFIPAIFLGILCNALVCLAVWLCYSARTTTDKILSIIPPITAFVTAGFEHSIANMYFISIGLFIKQWAGSGFFEVIGKTAADFPNLTWSKFLFSHLVPVTIGNIIGGGLFVGLVYWFIYLHPSRKA